MGLDVGDKTIGVSISDELGWTAQGLEVIRRDRLNKAEELQKLQDIVSQYDIKKIIIGLPKNMNGTIGPRGELCITFAKQLEEALGIPTQMWDERLSTVAAEKVLIKADVSRKKRKQVVDKMAAMMILQGYLDSQK